MSNALIKKTSDFLQQPKQIQFLSSLLASTEEEASRVVKTAILQVMANPKLASCDPLSVFRSVAQAAQLGLELGAEAHIIPYGSTATMQADYKGLMRLAIGPGIAKVRGDVVYAEDDFAYVREPLSLTHVPMLSDDRGDFRLAYAVAYDHNGDQIEATVILASEMAKFQSASRSPAWKEWPDRMRIKAAIKRCCRHLSLNTKAARLLRIEDAADSGQFVDPEIDDLGQVIDAPKLEEGSHKIYGKPDMAEGAEHIGPEASANPTDDQAPSASKTDAQPAKQKGKRKCGVCGETGHNARRCPSKDAGEPVETDTQRLEDARRAVQEAKAELAESGENPPLQSDSDAPGWGFGK